MPRPRKGHGVSFRANVEDWHGKALDPDQAKAAVAELGGERHVTVQVQKPEEQKLAPWPPNKPLQLPSYPVGGKEATHKAYGDALAALGNDRAEIVALDGEVSNSTYADEFKKAFPDRLFEMFTAKQQLLGAAVGLAVLGKRAFASTFAAF